MAHAMKQDAVSFRALWPLRRGVNMTPNLWDSAAYVEKTGCASEAI